MKVKVTRFILLNEKALSAFYYLNKWPDLDQTGTDR